MVYAKTELLFTNNQLLLKNVPAERKSLIDREKVIKKKIPSMRDLTKVFIFYLLSVYK